LRLSVTSHFALHTIEALDSPTLFVAGNSFSFDARCSGRQERLLGRLTRGSLHGACRRHGRRFGVAPNRRRRPNIGTRSTNGHGRGWLVFILSDLRMFNPLCCALHPAIRTHGQKSLKTRFLINPISLAYRTGQLHET
jgi:hypothetical protein